MMMFLWSTIIATLVGLVSAAVIPRDSGFKTLSQAQVGSTDVYAHYSAAVMCNPQALTYWNCGSHCQATPNFALYATGGDGVKAPFWFAGYDSNLDSIIVAHQGTNKKKFFSHLANTNGAQTPLDPNMFNNISSAVTVYQGFAAEHAQCAGDVLQAVDSLLQTYQNSKVTIVGHSLGAAIALLDGLLLKTWLPPTTDVRVVGYGMPRVGNDAFASYMDDMLSGSIKHINNKRDPVPVVPAITLGYHHVTGEIHVQDSGEWIVCPGQDNGDPRCIVGTVTSINNANFADHRGPYNNILLNCNS